MALKPLGAPSRNGEEAAPGQARPPLGIAHMAASSGPKDSQQRLVAQGYPQTPGFKDDGPGREAAVAYAPQAGSRRAQVLEALAAGPGTAEEIGARIDLHWFLTRPRLSELLAMGLVAKTGERGRGALGGSVNRWRITTPEERALHTARQAAADEKGDAA